MPTKKSLHDLMQMLPPPGREELSQEIRSLRKEKVDHIIVLDDDPTGTQTVHDIPVLTQWDYENIVVEMESGTEIFYILTNSRSLPPSEAARLALEIGGNIKRASVTKGNSVMVISRSDSTLRGHFPIEVQGLIKAMAIPDPVIFLVPAFFEGGRYTIDDIHYVQEGENLIPAADTPFAQDKVFGYHHSNLRDWVVEKSDGQFSQKMISSISISELRGEEVQLRAKLKGLKGGQVCVVNAASYYDLKRFVRAILQSKCEVIFRSAASLVAALAVQSPKQVLGSSDLNFLSTCGGLIVVGSYVPKTTIQLQHLLDATDLERCEINVEELLDGRAAPSSSVADQIDDWIAAGKDVVIYTSRTLLSSSDDFENLQIGRRISSYLIDIVGSLTVEPRYLITKGGITSSDITTDALYCKRAMIRGQIIAGVPVWSMDDHSKFPGLNQVVFPGNVGGEDALTTVVTKLSANLSMR